jgi:hypothetical protein
MKNEYRFENGENFVEPVEPEYTFENGIAFVDAPQELNRSPRSPGGYPLVTTTN